MGDLESPEVINKQAKRLSKVAHLLGAQDLCFASLTSGIDALSDEELHLQSSINELAFIEDELASNLAQSSSQLQSLLKWRNILESELASLETSAGLERKREILIRMAKELSKELNVTMQESTGGPSITITQLLKQKERNAKKEEELKVKRSKLRVFQDLPPNLELARHELFQAQQTQKKLIQLRERLLGSMASSMS